MFRLNQIIQICDPIICSMARRVQGQYLLKKKFSNNELKVNLAQRSLSLSIRWCVCVYVCESLLPCKCWRTSVGHRAKPWISTILLCSSAGGKEVWFACRQSQRVSLTLQLLHHIGYVHRRPTIVPWRRHVDSLQLSHKVGHWCREQEILHSCPEWDIPSAPPSLSLSLCLPLCLLSLQEQVQLNLRFHAGTSRLIVQ